MVSIKLSSVCHKTWQSRDVRQGACLCGLIACIGSDWHGIGVPTRVSSYSDLQFGPWHAFDSNNLFMVQHRLLYRRLWKINEGGEVNKGGFRRSSFTSLHLFSSSLWLLRDESTTKCFCDVPCMSGLNFLFYVLCLTPTDN